MTVLADTPNLWAACWWCAERGTQTMAWSLWLVGPDDERLICRECFANFEQGERDMILNGLTGCDGYVYSYLSEYADLSRPVSVGEISQGTGYTERAIIHSLGRLEAWSLIERDRASNGHAYTFKILDDIPPLNGKDSNR